MKKTISVIVFFLLLNIYVKSQSNSFFKVGSKWVYETYVGGGASGLPYNITHTHEIEKDTLINGKDYNKIIVKSEHYVYVYVMGVGQYYGPFYGCNKNVFIRHDSIENKVYYFKDTLPERLLYDFNLNIGDTILFEDSKFLFGSALGLGENNSKYTVRDIDTIAFGGKFLKKFILDVTTGFDLVFPDSQNIIIEGIGSYAGLFWFQPSLVVEGEIHRSGITCFYNNNDTLISSNCRFDFFSLDCDSFPLISSLKEENNNYTLSMYPNPAIDEVKIEIQNSKEKIENIAIYDVTGRAIIYKTKEAKGQYYTLDIANVTSGIYFIEVGLSNGERIVKKLVRE